MKKEIEVPGTKEYYDEYLYIQSNYKKLATNPNSKIVKLTTIIYRYLYILIIFLTLFLFWYIKSNNKIHLLITILFFLAIILSILYIIMIKKRINKLINTYTKTILEINNKAILIENNNTKVKMELKDINKVLEGKYTITFIPKELSNHFITTRIEYKEEINKIINQNNIYISK